MDDFKWWNEPRDGLFPREKEEFHWQIDWRGLAEMLRVYSIAFVLLFVAGQIGYMSYEVVFGENCIKTHTKETPGGLISYPHERNEKACIIDFDHPSNSDTIIR